MIETAITTAKLSLYTLLEIYFGGDKCRNFTDFGQNVPKFFSAEINLRRIFISAEYLYPPTIYLRRNFSKFLLFWRIKQYIWNFSGQLW